MEVIGTLKNRVDFRISKEFIALWMGKRQGVYPLAPTIDTNCEFRDEEHYRALFKEFKLEDPKNIYEPKGEELPEYTRVQGKAEQLYH